MFKEVYYGKKVLVTGHTGFKGSWLTSWLLKLGAEVVGISKDIPTNPSMFVEMGLKDKIKDFRVDVRDLNSLKKIINNEVPDFIFHLAAQPIVSLSYSDPIETISSNVIGTTNILESIKKVNHDCHTVMITSDKAYDNVEQIWGYTENDRLGGKDIYSASKGAAELIIRSYYKSFFDGFNNNIKIAVGRAGNVIGGGDWAKDRIVVDSMLAWSTDNVVKIRHPNSTRPWQHVLEPLSGYLNLGMALAEGNEVNGEAFNFGPNSDEDHNVEKLISDLSKYWGKKAGDNAYQITGKHEFKEANLLKLNCDKAKYLLEWNCNLRYEEMIRFTSEWYFEFYHNKNSTFDKTMNQIKEFEEIAKVNLLKWTE